jgi:replication factor C large subunit
MWIEKHKPEELDGFYGSPKTVSFIKEWDGRPLILYGPEGAGKTLLAGLAAKFHGWDLIEVTESNIDQAEAMAVTSSLFGGRKLLLIEDVDELKQASKIKELVEVTKNPMLLTTRDYKSKKLTSVKKICLSLQLRRPMAATIANYLKEVCKKEGVEAEKEILVEIAKNSGGDFRAALNDLETLTAGKNKVTEDDLEILTVRDRRKDIYACLSIIFGGNELRDVVTSTWAVDEQPRDILYWITENTPALYIDKTSRAEAFTQLSKADVFLGRIMSRQYWGFLRYANPLMTAGVNINRPKKVNYTQYSFPKYWISMSKTKKTRNIESNIAAKLSPIVHASEKIVIKEYIPLFKTLVKNRVLDDKALESYGFGEEELDYIKN